MAAKASEDQVVSIEGRRLKLTNLDKVMYPATGTTKGDVIGYYVEIAEHLLVHARDRAATRKRWVHGVGTDEKPGQMFFQKNLDASTPDWVRRHTIEHSDHTNEYPLVNDAATVAWLAQVAALEIHVPQWRFGPRGARRNPDRLVLDLDPGDGVGLPECVEVARLARTQLTDVGLSAIPVTSGSKGIHLYAALDGKQTSEQISAFAHELARVLEADHPDLIVSDMKKSRRRGKVLVDWSQNNANKTTIAPYSLRGRTHPTVAVPRTWRELGAKDLHQLTYDEVLARMKRRKDPMADLDAGRPDPGEIRSGEVDRLERYRGMRDATKTPEPVPDGTSKGEAGTTFVIQEHHASSLHWDFRLERDGVLVSWAIPKGVPTDPKQNRLAIQTEDHPLDYARFEGTIPKGEYGGGEVRIWDSGTYRLDKWVAGKEVVATLTGRDGGGLGAPRKFSLIHTGKGGDDQWLIHLMQERSTPQAMLATLGDVDDLSEEDSWSYEMKWDGIRALIVVDSGGVRLMTRNGNDVTATYPEIVEALPKTLTSRSCVLDGEIVALDKAGVPSFSLLQSRMGLTKKPEVKAKATQVPVRLMLFDVLDVDGDSTVKRPYVDRRETLRSVVKAPRRGVVQVPPAFEGDVDAAMQSSRELRLEGVMAKRSDSAYASGRRTRDWIKIKHHRTQEVVVGGWRPGKGSRSSGVGSLLLGIPDGDGKLRYLGRVGTGFTQRDLDDFARRFVALERKRNPFAEIPTGDAKDAHWLKAELVGEVEYSDLTGSDRLRHPSWRGWRVDKRARDVVLETNETHS